MPVGVMPVGVILVGVVLALWPQLPVGHNRLAVRDQVLHTVNKILIVEI